MTLIAEAERIVSKVRVPGEDVFDDNASDWLEAPDVEAIAVALVDRCPELMASRGLNIRYAWKREGGPDGEAGKCKRLGKEARFLTRADFFIWVAADKARDLSGHQIEALVYHELCHIATDEKGKTVLRKHDVELFFSEVRRYGAWNTGLTEARQVFEQIALPL